MKEAEFICGCKLVVCNRVGSSVFCPTCPHSEPHERPAGERICTRWGLCNKGGEKYIRVRCEKPEEKP